MSEQPSFIAALGDIVGQAQVFTSDDDLAAHRSDGRGAAGGRPLALVRPSSAESVSAIAVLAAAHGIRLIVQGARTGLVGAGLAGEAGGELLVSLDRMDRHISIDPVNRTATVDAGVRLSALNSAASEHGLTLPIDLGADPTIGGMIAANTGGARLLRYGDMRASLMQVETVRADTAGTMMNFGAPLWKNNVGLDLKQMIVGSSGSLGIVTRATIKLQPLPSARVCALLALRRADDALPLLAAMEAAFSGLLSAFEGIGRPALAAVFEHLPSFAKPFAMLPDYALLIEITAGSAFDDDVLEDRLAAVLSPFMDADDPAILDVVTDRRDRLWAIRHAVPEALRAHGSVVACDVAVRRGDVMAFREMVAVRIAAQEPELEPHDFGHIGDGGMHFNLVWPKALGPLDQATAERARRIVFDAAVTEFGGSFSAEHGIGPRNIGEYPRYVAGSERQLAGGIQRLFAPVGIGRVDFGTQAFEEE